MQDRFGVADDQMACYLILLCLGNTALALRLSLGHIYVGLLRIRRANVFLVCILRALRWCTILISVTTQCKAFPYHLRDSCYLRLTL